MAVDSQGTARSSFDLKSAQLPVMAVALRDTEVAVLTRDLAQRLADDPDFFDNDPVLIDLQHVRDSTEDIDFPKLIKALKRHRTLPVAVCGGSPAQMAAAHAAGLMPAPDAQPARAKPTAVEVREVEVIREVPVEVEVVREVPAPAPNALIVDKPLRSGQQVYARGTDLVVMAVVSYGAEVIADGNVHVYAPLRGRAVAGARGNTEARIFSTCMEPQLLSIAGNYRALETDLPKDIAGKPAQARLEGEKLVIEPMRLA
ncbi:septum site-determining protein MinC [Comamonas aquatica]|jgi:septum site-determining protein MinC|uniref:Probable septum site-determining protein MinC n=1 Tax=Comamonas aquatica TaxID=225991 RepID=A0AA42L0X6_9BURK|nr:septum site-determining protein MinC [Comamonas aquatica]MDH0361938.1 septum site-determining protein MinC [Comamonas aquatica]MDH0372256.1 septum site-determining protein MinC [Comamonas aquatica]MDH0494473.1 septum site-determining protein MinC [Comamonas aquatica]MDH1764158.1 septum site-determining protein MinC [Comamonas aquatica]WBM42157.1 septum site-determining protein MinC [Comamonas aquatica]